MDVVAWLLDSDPAIRWQVMRDLTDAPEEDIAAERARVASEGCWGARLLDLQREDGQWDGGIPTFTSTAASQWWQSLPPKRKGTLFPEWTSTAWSLMLLRNFGLDPVSAGARRAVRLVREHCQWEHDGEPFFAGEVEPCINGKVVAIGAYFGEDVQRTVDRLLGEQMSDGGWNCEQENGSTRGSFHTTIDVLDGMLEYERAAGGSPDVNAARLRGHQYLLERRLLRRLSTGEVTDPALDAVLLPDLLALRRSPRSRLPSRGRRGSRTSGWPKRSTWSSRSAMPTAAGPSRIRTPAGCTSRWTRARADRAGGILSGLCVCSGGTSRRA